MTPLSEHALWSNPTEPLEFEPDDAHLWRVSLTASDESVQAFEQTLSADERLRADSFRFEKLRRRFVIGRGVLRILLGRYLGCAPAELTFVYGPHGKPSLMGCHHARAIYFNVSQSEDVALVAVTWTGEIGVDLEHVRSISEWPEIAERILTHDRDAAPPANLADFFHEWTRHEARVKAAGLGLGGQPTGEQKWAVRSLSLEDNLVAAIAFPIGVRHFRCWQWREDSALA
jgi:4'-phosphopantetheinyl transferase